MRKIIMIVIAMVFAVNNAQAMTENEVAQYVLDTVPGATASEAARCADKWAHGGHFMMRSEDVTLVCEKMYLSKTWDR